MGLFVAKGSVSRNFPDPDPGDLKRPDPTGSGSATLLNTELNTDGLTQESDPLNIDSPLLTDIVMVGYKGRREKL